MKRLLLVAAALYSAANAFAASQTVVGAAAESKMDQCNLADQYAAIAAQIHRTSNNYHAYVVGVDSTVQANYRFKNAWDIADQTGKLVFSDKLDPGVVQGVVYQKCMQHPEHFRVQY